MNRFERQIFLRFLRAAGGLFLFFLWLLAVLTLMQIMGEGEPAEWKEKAREIIAANMTGLELCVALAGSLGLVFTLCRLKSAGILPLFLAAGYRSRRLSRVIVLAALAVLFLQGGLRELTLGVEGAWGKKRQPVPFWKAGRITVWAPAYSSPSSREASRKTVWKNLFLLDNDSLALCRAGEAVWSNIEEAYLLSSLTPLWGEPLSLSRFAPRQKKQRFLSPPGILEWFSPQASPGEIMAGLNRMGVGMILSVLAAYAALLLPVSRQGRIYLIFLFLAPGVTLGMVYCSIQVWFESGVSVWLVPAGWWGILVVSALGLERAFCRRGIQLA